MVSCKTFFPCLFLPFILGRATIAIESLFWVCLHKNTRSDPRTRYRFRINSLTFIPQTVTTNVLTINLQHNLFKQECIPVGCVPADRRPYAGVWSQGGGGSPSIQSRGGGFSIQLVMGGGVLHPGGGVLHPAGGGLLARPPPCEQNDRQV